MLPEGFCEKMKTLLGTEYQDFLAALDQPRAVGLRLNPLKTQTPPVLPFGLEPVPWAANGYYYDPETRPGLHPFHDAGLYYLQEPSAMAPAALLDPKPGERVLDLCAAPGGKSTQLAGQMMGRGILVCNEIHPKRASILASNIERLGVANALVLNEHPARLGERFAGYFDRVLVDAPCSGEGMFRKHDAAFEDWSLDTVEMCARRQAEILDSAAKMLRPGGRMVYSTCTFSPEENEGSIESFLRRHPDFSVLSANAPFFSPGRPEWIPEGRSELAGTFRLWPHRLRGEGHFAAVLQKSGDDRTQIPEEPAMDPPRPVLELMEELGISLPEGLPVLFGDRVFWGPAGLPALRGLKVLRPGLELAELRKGRAVPAHALALWTKDAAASLDLPVEQALTYLSGQTLPSDTAGWTLVRAEGLSLGWGKASGGVLKNHYPKGLRRIR